MEATEHEHVAYRMMQQLRIFAPADYRGAVDMKLDGYWSLWKKRWKAMLQSLTPIIS